MFTVVQSKGVVTHRNGSTESESVGPCEMLTGYANYSFDGMEMMSYLVGQFLDLIKLV